jgi:DNA-binding response OmpR family regulator
VIFLTALSDLKDEEQGFSLGGDDYFVKPYDISRLEMRVSAVLRRTSSQSMGRAEIPPLSVDPAAGQCVLSGEHIFLSPMELRLLHYFMKNPNKMINRNKLYEDVWGASSSAITTTVVVHVHRLRQKLGMAEKGSYFKISSEKQDYMFSKIRY